MRADLAPQVLIAPRTWLLAGAAAWALAVWALALFGLGGRIERLPDDPSLVTRLPNLPRPSPERLGPLAQYSEIGARPLFSEDRRPQPFFLQTEGDEQPAEATFDFVLTSVLLSPQLRMAIVQPVGGGESVRLKLGETPDAAPSWRLIAIAPRSAIFEGPDGQRTLDLRTYDGSGGETPTALRQPGGGRPPPGTPATTIAPNPAPPPSLAGPTPPASPTVNPPTTDPRPAPPVAVTDADATVTPEAQMEAIRKRIEARRAQLKREAPAPVPDKNP